MKNSADTQRIDLERDIFFSNNPKATEKDFNDYLLQRIDLAKAWIKAGENVEGNTEWINTAEGYLAQITNSETIENNKLIAEFMGLKLNGGGRSIFDEPNLSFFRVTEYEKDGLCPYCHNEVSHGRNIKCYVLNPEKLHYDTDWNWLMPVVEKIETMSLTENKNHLPEFFIMYDEREEFKGWYWSISIIKLFRKECLGRENSRIDAVYSAVIEFIKWHNQQNISLS